jgi:hypothetical protein
MKRALRSASALAAIVCLAIAVWFGLSGSWMAALFFFLFFGGVELALYATGYYDRRDSSSQRDSAA